MTRKSLSDILHQGDRETLEDAWDRTEAAEDFVPLPGGEYEARIISGEFFTSKTRGAPGYKLAFRVLEGEFADRQFWHDVWLTPAALPMAKRDLGKLGVTSLDQLENPLPPGIRCRVKLALRKDDDGTQCNRVKRFEVVGIDPPEDDAFAPADADPAPDPPESQDEDPGSEPEDAEASFDPEKLDAEDVEEGGAE